MASTLRSTSASVVAHEQTLMRRFQALFFAPLLGIDRLTRFDTHEHPLPTLLGGGYHSSTLRQFLGQLDSLGFFIFCV